MPSPKLRAVEDGEAPKHRRLKVDVAASEGSDIELLMAMRDRVATAIANPNCAARDLAALTRRLQEIRKDIEALEDRAREESADGDRVPDEAWDEEAI